MSETKQRKGEASGRGSRGRRRWLVLGALLAVVVLAAIVLPLVIDVERHRGRVEQALQEITGWEAELGQIRLSVLRGPALRVSPVKLAAPEGGSRFEAERVSVRASWMPLLRGRLEIRSVELLGPDILLVRPDAERGWVLPEILGQQGDAAATEPAGTQGPGTVTVNRVSVRDGRLRFEDRSVDPPTSFAVERLELDVDPRNGEMVGSGAVAEDGGRITWTGRADGRLEARLEDLRTEAIGPWLGEGVLHPGGTLGGDLSMAPGEGLSGSLTGRSLRLLAGTAPAPATTVDFRFLPDAGGWDVEQLELQAGAARIVGTGSLLPVSLKLDLPETPLEAALELTEALVPLGLDLSPPGSARATVRIDLPDGGDVSYEAEGEISAARFLAADVLPEVTDVRAAFRLARAGSLELEVIEGSVGGGPLRGTVFLDSVDPPGTLSFTGDLEQAALGVLLGGFVEHAPERVTGPAAVRGKVAVDLAAPLVDASAIGGSLALRADEVSLSGWDLERAVREELRERLGKLADVAALLDPGARKLLAEETAEAGEATRRLLEAVAADADFDALPWTLEDVALRAGQVSARGRGSFDPVAGGLDLEMRALLDAELTERYTARYAPLRSLVDEEGRLTMPMRIGGTLLAPSLSLDLRAMASSSLDADTGEDAVEDLLEGILRRKILKKDD